MQSSNTYKKILPFGIGAVNLCRLLVGLTFLVAGFVKAIDPLGSQYKMEDYLTAMGLVDILPTYVLLSSAVLLSAVEFSFGVLILLGMYRRMVSRLSMFFMVMMTAITVWIYAADPVKDCGCFGDAFILTNTQTLLKNIVLLASTVVMTVWPDRQFRMLSRNNQWIVVNYTVIFIIALSVWCLYDIPTFDFRPYYVGADVRAGMTIPEDARKPEFETTFILEKNGMRQEFDLEHYPDSTWTFIDSRNRVIKEGYQPPIHDFSIVTTDSTHEDITEDIISDHGYTFLLISPWIEMADDSNFGYIDEIYEYAQANKCRFICLTSSDSTAVSHWRDITGAEYPVYNTDATTLKTIIRSNPGLVLMHDGQIIGKWSHHNLPHGEDLTTGIDKAEWAHPDADSGWYRLMQILSWFFIPLIILIIADRLWAWSGTVKRLRDEKIRKVREQRQSLSFNNKLKRK